MVLTIDHPELAALHRLWLGIAEGTLPPDRAAFTPEVLLPWLGHIGIVEVELAPVRLRVRLAGLHLVEHDGQDNTGRYLDEVVPPEDRAQALAPYWHCLETRAPHYDASYSRPGRSRRYLMHRLLLPVSTNGGGVDQIIAGIYALPMAETPRH